MLSLSNITLNSVVSFELYAESILGINRRNVKILGILDAQDASRYIEPVTMHAAVYASLPDDTPNDFSAYPYLKIKLESGETEAIGLPWIRDESYEEIALSDLQLRLNNISPSRRADLMNLLAANGFNAVDVKEIT